MNAVYLTVTYGLWQKNRTETLDKSNVEFAVSQTDRLSYNFITRAPTAWGDCDNVNGGSRMYD